MNTLRTRPAPRLTADRYTGRRFTALYGTLAGRELLVGHLLAGGDWYVVEVAGRFAWARAAAVRRVLDRLDGAAQNCGQRV